MTEMYTWPEAARMLLSFLLTLCVMAQTLALVLSRYRHPRSRSRIVENLLELSVLFQIFVCTLLHGQMLLAHQLGLIAPAGYIVLRYLAFAAVLVLAVIVMVSIKKAWPVFVIVASGATLPAMQIACGRVFAYIYLVVMFFWLLRSVHICLLRYREIKTSLSALSIKNAIDSLHSGLMFGETDGFVLLANREMQRLMLAIGGRVRRNGWAFYEALSAGDMLPGCQRAEYEGQIVCLLPDETAWRFTRAQLEIKGRVYILLTATDITQRWNLTAQLRQREEQLKQKSDALKDAIANIHTLSRQRETQKAKMRAHDVLGQRLSLLLRTIRSEETVGHEVLQTLLQGLIEDLKAEQSAPPVQDELDGLQQAFAAIGVIIEMRGPLPEDETKARLFVDVIRESVTNAVRHGFATHIVVDTELGEGCVLRVSNNGRLPRGPITEGGGIAGMRMRVEPHGGALDVAASPDFVLTVRLPGGDANE